MYNVGLTRQLEMLCGARASIYLKVSLGAEVGLNETFIKLRLLKCLAFSPHRHRIGMQPKVSMVIEDVSCTIKSTEPTSTYSLICMASDVYIQDTTRGMAISSESYELLVC